MIRVALLEERPIFRAGLQAILEEGVDVKVVLGASTFHQVLQYLEEAPIDLLYADVRLLGGKLHEASTTLHAVRPGLSVVLFLDELDLEVTSGALSVSAVGYLPRGASGDELLQSLQAVISGSSYIHPKIAGTVLRTLRAQGDVEESPLSARERDVLQLAIGGARNQEIATALGLSLSTVKTHVRALYRKLEVTDRTQLVLKLRSRDTL